MDKFIIMNVHDVTLKNPKNNLKKFPHFFWCMKKNPMVKSMD
jgi:hypothetical protein